MKKTVLRLTRHAPQPEQLLELERLFGPVTVQTESATLSSNPREAVAEFDRLAQDAQVVEAVLPLHLLEAVLRFSAFSKRGGLLIRAVMDRKLHEDGTASFEFSHYEEVLRVEVETRRL